MSITDALRALCDKHDLTSISIHAGTGDGRHRPYSFVHWGEGGVTHKYGETVEEALAKAICAANTARHEDADVPALELGEVGA